MAYAYFKVGKHNDHSVFDLFFRTPPFRGQYAVFAGLEEVLRFVNTFRFSPEEIHHIRTLIPHGEDEFFTWLGTLDCSQVKIYALAEGTICFPRVPLLRVEGPIGVCQLLETTLLVLVNFATLVATNAARHRMAAGNSKRLLEFGLRRAQGPDGGMSASYYSYMGGFDGSSNVLAGRVYGIPTSGTMAHSFITSFNDDEPLKDASRLLLPKDAKSDDLPRDIFALAMKYRDELSPQTQKVGELKAFVSYAASYPNTTLCLVDTYNSLFSGIPNFVCVALALHDVGYRALGIRLDSGDLAYLSREARKLFVKIGEKYKIDYFASLSIVASNDLNEATILSLNQQGHEIDVFGIGTQIVTCYNQPALGGVYKLVEISGIPRMKLSEEFEKVPRLIHLHPAIQFSPAITR
jgi:nicotinate phosphoribosyltransferase